MKKNRITTAAVLLAVALSTFCTAHADNPSVQGIEANMAETGKTAGTIDQNQLAKIAALLKANPNDAKAHYGLAELYRHAGLGDLAEQEYLKSDQLAPEQPDAMLALFTQSFSKNDYPGAMQYFRYLSKRFPKKPEVILMNGVICLPNHADLADQFFQRAVNMSPPGNGVRTAVASFRLSWGRPQDALNLAMVDLKKEPNNHNTIVVVAKSFYALGKYSQALPYLKQAYMTDYAGDEIGQWYARALFNGGRNNEALEPALVYMATQSEKAKLEKGKELVLSIMANMPREEILNCIEMANNKLDKTLYQSRMHMGLGDVFDRQAVNNSSMLKFAMDQYTTAIKMAPTVGRVYYRLAKDEEATGSYKEAIAHYQQALALDPGQVIAKERLARLQARLQIKKHDLAWRLKDSMRQWFH